MQNPAKTIPGLAGAKGLRPADEVYGFPSGGWCRAALSGRLVEISGRESPAMLTAAMALVRDAQEEGETTAWVTPRGSLFFPPDAEAGGVDLGALAVIRVPELRHVAPAADKLARSGAFGLIVLDLQGEGRRLGSRDGRRRPPRDTVVPTPLQSRLLGLAQKHDIAVVFLLDKPGRHPSLGSLISLRGEATRTRIGHNRFQVEVRVVKDKYRAPGWSHTSLCHGPAGLR